MIARALHRAVLLGALLLGLALPPAAMAQADLAELARKAAERLDAAQASLAAASGARNRVDALTRTIRAYEDGLDALREGLRQAALREAAITSEFEARSAELSRLLAVLMSIERAQGPIGLIHPAGPLGMARSAMIVGDLTPALQRQVDELHAQLDELAATRRLQQIAADDLQRGLEGVQEARAALSQAMSERRELPAPLSGDAAEMERLARSVSTMQDFATGLLELGRATAGPEPLRSFESARGQVPLPVHGQLLRGFQEPDAAGVQRPGLILATAPRALVSAPWPATVRYAGPLLDFGNVVILEPQADYLLILAGLQDLFVRTGEMVLPGGALGMMGGTAPAADDILLQADASTGSVRTETLYIELRHAGEPVDPAPWFAETKEQTR